MAPVLLDGFRVMIDQALWFLLCTADDYMGRAVCIFVDLVFLKTDLELCSYLAPHQCSYISYM